MSFAVNTHKTGKRSKRIGGSFPRPNSPLGGRDDNMTIESGDQLLTPAEVATMLRVTSKTVTRWAKTGKVSSVRTLGGHRRFPLQEIEDLMRKSQQIAIPVRTTPDPRDEYARIALSTLPPSTS
jgi:excisionase family DNA binding protein